MKRCEEKLGGEKEEKKKAREIHFALLNINSILFGYLTYI